MIKYYRFPGLSECSHQECLSKLKMVSPRVVQMATEICFCIELDKGYQLCSEDEQKLLWILTLPFSEKNTSKRSFLQNQLTQQVGCQSITIEVGPRLNFSTAWSTNAVSICQSVGLIHVKRIEEFMRYVVEVNIGDESSTENGLNEDLTGSLASVLHDKMTQCTYDQPLERFDVDIKPDQWFEVDVLAKGRFALEKVNQDLGLAFDDWDLDYYTKLFSTNLKRNPTSVECFDLAQSNSEHSRHWFFRGKIFIDGKEINESLMDMVKKTNKLSNDNSVIRLTDNSSAIKGYKVPVMLPFDTSEASSIEVNKSTRHIIFTAETHNFPTGVAPFPGATTGTGGRIRDVQAAGTGSNVVAGTVGYCFGNLNIPGYDLPWETNDWKYPLNFASPCEIAIEASNGASDYGNKFGEPVLAGFSRSFGMLWNEERREWIKPIMFSGGIGSIDSRHISKHLPEKGMNVVKIGGPIYRIGVGGGSASSIQVQGDNASELDFGAVQRGDAEMEQKLNRVIRACIEMKDNNPICSIHDQGAGGNGNVLKELVEPTGAIIYTEAFKLGDPTISTLELWGAEYQESNALLVRPEHRDLLEKICKREKLDVCFVGSVTGDGKIVLKESYEINEHTSNGNANEVEAKKAKKRDPVDIELDVVLGKMPRKEFKMNRMKPTLHPLRLDPKLTVRDALERVLRLPSVASKRYLTNKVDRSVTGLVAQQQCVGPLHTPVADVAVTSLSYFDTLGAATAIGEQPIKILVDSCAGARMCLGEALTNLIFAQVTELKDVKCSANWMWPAKLPGEGVTLYDACRSVCEAMTSLGVAIDGGKDSLSMAARVGGETVKAPGSLVVSVYAPCPDITATVTPDFKIFGGKGSILYVKLDKEHCRLGGSALAQVFNQIGDISPDLDKPEILSKCFGITQNLLSKRMISSGHDVSDGGLITTLLEMAFAGNCGLSVNIKSSDTIGSDEAKNIPLNLLFAEELGIVLEVLEENVNTVCEAYTKAGIICNEIGHTGKLGQDGIIKVSIDDVVVLEEKMTSLRDVWEATSFQLARLQSNTKCVMNEESILSTRKTPPYRLSFTPSKRTPGGDHVKRPKVAVIREEGSNGDREMSASLIQVGFEVWDVSMQDICAGQVTLDKFRGIVFVGGFSFADVLGSAKGWAAVSLFNEVCQKEFQAFLAREDTFSLGVCNGCQLMSLLGWVGKDSTIPGSDRQQGACFTHNESESFESRFVTVSIQKSDAIMLRDMEGSTLGVWVSHGEGRAQFKNENILKDVVDRNLAPIRYVDDDGAITMKYPLNPNGSPDGIAALCSDDGRHLAMMPHPERCTLLWQWPWLPEEWKHLECSPWLKMFQNAFDWCN